VIYKGILGKIPEFLGTKCGRPATLLGHLVYPWALFDSVFSRCILLIERSTFILWNGKIPRKRGVPSLLIPQLISFSLTSLPKLLFILSPAMDPFNALSHCRHKDDPIIERGITRQGHVVCVDHINRPTEGLRCCKGGHWRSQRAIGKDSRPGGQLPWPVGHGLWPIGPP
jgi:hypothetical protein